MVVSAHFCGFGIKSELPIGCSVLEVRVIRKLWKSHSQFLVCRQSAQSVSFASFCLIFGSSG